MSDTPVFEVMIDSGESFGPITKTAEATAIREEGNSMFFFRGESVVMAVPISRLIAITVREREAAPTR